MKSLFPIFLGLQLFAVLPVLASDKADESPELQSRVNRYYSSYTINEDGSFTETGETAITVLKEQAIRYAKQTSITYSTSIQKAEVIEAYTKKPDGRRIDSPTSNFQVESNTGKGKGAPVFSDLTTTTVVFPEVEVGDMLVFSYRLTASEPMFPNQFSTRESFLRTEAFDDVRIRIDAPVSLWTHYSARELTEVLNTEKDGRRVIEWTFANPNPIKSKRHDFSVYDIEKDPGFEYSTFKNYAEIAEVYGARARAKAIVTQRIAKLAGEIAKDSKSLKETAKAFYDWVAVNITYAGNCIGLGAVVPHDTDFILDNRMGDCKDHATLLQALLSAKGIESTQVLVNAGTTYRLPKIPVVSMVNHVINYIPSMDLYVDSTSNATPFGMLPFSDADKPVLLVDGYKEGSKTPTLPIGTNRQTMQTEVHIQPDGSIKGDVKVSQTGMYAADSRARMRNLKKEVLDDLVKNLYKSMGYIGSGTVEKEDPTALLGSYRYSATFEVKNFYSYPGTGAFTITPYFYNEAPVSGFINQGLQQDEERIEASCTNGVSIEEYRYYFPKGMKLLSIPDNMKLSNSFLTYEASYKQKGQVLTVKRTLDDRTHGNVCPAQIADEYREFARKVWPNLKAQVIYK